MQVDVAIVGAGAAGLFCAGVAGQLGLKVLLLEHNEQVAEKIRISGGGRCNFTNRHTAPENFLSDNPHFCCSALSRYTPQNFIDLLKRYGIAFHEKHKGQLFCDRSAQDLIAMLLAECTAGAVTLWPACTVGAVVQTQYQGAEVYAIESGRGLIHARQLVVATGGLSIAKLGASDWGYRLARQFGLRVVAPRPALVPLMFDGAAWQPYAQLSGLSLPVVIQTQHANAKGRASPICFAEDLLFTHRGLSGPAVLQISSYWHPGSPVELNLAPDIELENALLRAKHQSHKRLVNELSGWLPQRLANTWVQSNPAWQAEIGQMPDALLRDLAQTLSAWTLTPTGTEGYKKAEVTAGGVDTRDLSSQTMESKQSGLYFIGEVVDVTGWLGGYNFQWAWASAFACAQALAMRPPLI